MNTFTLAVTLSACAFSFCSGIMFFAALDRYLERTYEWRSHAFASALMALVAFATAIFIARGMAS